MSLRHTQRNQVLRALDPNLPFLAIEAAVDIDNLLLHGEEEVKARQELAHQLLNFRGFKGNNGVKSFLDPATLTVLGAAFREAIKEDSLEEINILLEKTDKIVELLRSGDLKDNPQEAEKVRDFCLELSDAAIAFRSSVDDTETDEPFRK